MVIHYWQFCSFFFFFNHMSQLFLFYAEHLYFQICILNFTLSSKIRPIVAWDSWIPQIKSLIITSKVPIGNYLSQLQKPAPISIFHDSLHGFTIPSWTQVQETFRSPSNTPILPPSPCTHPAASLFSSASPVLQASPLCDHPLLAGLGSCYAFLTNPPQWDLTALIPPTKWSGTLFHF